MVIVIGHSFTNDSDMETSEPDFKKMEAYDTTSGSVEFIASASGLKRLLDLVRPSSLNHMLHSEHSR